MKELKEFYWRTAYGECWELPGTPGYEWCLKHYGAPLKSRPHQCRDAGDGFCRCGADVRPPERPHVERDLLVEHLAPDMVEFAIRGPDADWVPHAYWLPEPEARALIQHERAAGRPARVLGVRPHEPYWRTVPAGGWRECLCGALEHLDRIYGE